MPVTHHDLDGRAVELWIPDGVRPDSPLLLAHDGQNCFDGTHSISGHGWQLDAAAIRAANACGVATPVIVAPWNIGERRVMEYGPQDVFERNDDWLHGYRALHGDAEAPCGNAYIDWCAERVLPWAASQAGIHMQRERTAVLGSSMGGLASLAALARRPVVFECALCVSTHWASGDDGFVRACIDLLPQPGHHRLWFDHGDQGLDAQYAPLQDVADQALSDAGWADHFERHAFPGTDHSESAWAARAETVLAFWLRGLAS